MRAKDGGLVVTTRTRWTAAIDEAVRRHRVLDSKFSRPSPGFWKHKVQRIRDGGRWTWGVTWKDPS